MRPWDAAITVIIFAIICVALVTIIKTLKREVSIRITCDLTDKNAYDNIIEMIASNFKIKEIAYRERKDTIIIDIFCRPKYAENLRKEFKKIKNVEVI